MKTNHQRNFRENTDPNAVLGKYIAYSARLRLPMSDRIVSAGVTASDHTNGKRGIAKDRRGAKKFINSRARFHENAALKRLLATQEAFSD